MHSATYGNTRFHFSSGLAGNVIVNVPAPATKAPTTPGEPETWQVEIPGEDLRDFVLASIRDQIVGRLEDAEGDDLVDLLTKSSHQCRSCGLWLEGAWNAAPPYSAERRELQRQMDTGYCDPCLKLTKFRDTIIRVIERAGGEIYEVGHAHGGNAYRRSLGEDAQRVDDGWMSAAMTAVDRIMQALRREAGINDTPTKAPGAGDGRWVDDPARLP